MNYIAHLHIADITKTSYAGSLLGDFKWQIDPTHLALYKGWQLHQAVDTFVDAHPITERFKGLPRAGRRRFSGIIQDIVMDYWLVCYWERFSTDSFELFSHRVVASLGQDKHLCPERLQKMISSLEERNWLAGLGTKEGVERAIRSIQKRWSLGRFLDPFIGELDLLIEQAKQPFLLLYPEVLENACAAAAALDTGQVKK